MRVTIQTFACLCIVVVSACAGKDGQPVALQLIPPSTTTITEPFVLPVDTSTTTEVPVVIATSTTEPFRDSVVIKELVAAAEAM